LIKTHLSGASVTTFAPKVVPPAVKVVTFAPKVIYREPKATTPVATVISIAIKVVTFVPSVISANATVMNTGPKVISSATKFTTFAAVRFAGADDDKRLAFVCQHRHHPVAPPNTVRDLKNSVARLPSPATMW
jgi:hypothetical protein